MKTKLPKIKDFYCLPRDLETRKREEKFLLASIQIVKRFLKCIQTKSYGCPHISLSKNPQSLNDISKAEPETCLFFSLSFWQRK